MEKEKKIRLKWWKKFYSKDGPVRRFIDQLLKKGV